MNRATRTGGREATDAIIAGRIAISVGRAAMPEPEGFAWQSLGKLARLESGHTPRRAEPAYWDGDIPWIGIRDATSSHGNVISDTAQHITEAGLENSSARLLPAGTVCLSRTASVGYVVQTAVPMATSQDFVNWVCGPDLLPDYLRYILMLEQDSIRRFSYGTTHQTMYYPDAKALHVLIPSLADQKAIAEVLGALDDKIAANAKLVVSADNLRSVRFRALRHERAVPLSSIAKFVNGRAFTKGATGTGRVVIRIAELNSGLGGSTVRTELEVAEEYLARPGSILFAWSGSLTVKRWFRDEAIVNQHIFNVLPNRGTPDWLAFELVESKINDFRLIAADKATTMGHIQRRHLDEAVALPDAESMRRIDAEMTSNWSLALSTEQESERLAALRDTLLPELMSGRLRVKDAEQAVEEVL